MEISGLLYFIAVSIYLATHSITSGKRAGIATAAAFGVSEILRQSAI